MQVDPDAASPEHVLAFWFPDDLAGLDPTMHLQFWQSRMRGGMDADIRASWARVTEAGARGDLDRWAETPRGRLALIVILDQFPRSLWRDTPAAFAQDIKAARLALDGIDAGHYGALGWPWEKNFYLIAITHCEGPDHLARMDRAIALADAEVAAITGALGVLYQDMGKQPRRVREVIARFGRHPHRNAVLGRPSSAAEAAYIAEGQFPHEREIEAPD